MRLQKHIISLICCISVFLSGKASDKDTYFYHLTTKDGLSQMSILSIYQDEFSAMWFGTTEGLDRYNGSNIESFKPSDNKGLKNNRIQYITGNKSGSLYVIVGNDLAIFDLNTHTFGLLKSGVQAIRYVDNQLWIAKEDSILQYDESKKTFNLFAKLSNQSINVTSIIPTKSGLVWLGTTNGLIEINRGKSIEFSEYFKNKDISYLFLDSNDALWIGTKTEGVYTLNTNREISHYYHDIGKGTISDNQIRNIQEDKQGNIWIATFYGLNKYDRLKQRWQQFIHDDSKPHSISHSSIYALYLDQQGSIWIGTYYGGVNYFNSETDIFNFYGADFLNISSVNFPYVGSMTEDDLGNLWICTEGGDLNCLNLKTRNISRYKLRNDLFSAERYNQKCILYNKEKGLLYIGLHNGGIAIFDINKKTTRILNNFLPDSLPSIKQTNNTVNHAQFYKDKLILMSNIGLVSMDIHTEEFSSFSNDPIIDKELTKAKLLTFHIDKKNRLWIVIADGLACINLNTKEITEYKHDESDEHSIGKCEINYIFENNSGSLFFSSMGCGIFKFNEVSANFDNYTSQADGLMSDFCYSISESPSGNLILLHNRGLSFIDPNNPRKNIYRSSPNFPIVGFNTGNSVYITKNDEIFVGGVNGLMSFFEKDLRNANKNYNIYFDKLYLGNTLITASDSTGILPMTLPLCQEIRLNYDQNNFKIEFATNSYIQTINHNYEYRLQGFDKEWIRSDIRLISYTNLNPGHYVLEVRDIDNPVIQQQIDIIISPPYYKSTIAYVIYATIIILIVYCIIRFYKWRANMQESLKFEHKEKERIEELNQMKLRFFTNVSHEFRTPLTLISSYVDALLVQPDLPQSIRSKVDKIYRNTTYLLDLITELLDFRKQEQGFYKLKVVRVELISYIKQIYDTFKDYANTKNIQFRLITGLEEIYIYVDPEYFRKAIYNLLSNAFKYTSEKGEISISIKLQGANHVLIDVQDTGVGIAPEYLDKIFDRFYQIEYRSSETTVTTGTGIGLALTKEIINNHGGQISVSSILNKGSIFSISMKLGYTHFSEDMIKLEGDISSIMDMDTLSKKAIGLIKDDDHLELETLNKINETGEKPRLLIVDDNIEIVDILSELFGQFYHIIRAYNGKEAFEIIKKDHVDIIISDILMPEMSGKEFCYKLKNNILTSHIPIVLLTSQTSEAQVADGYLFGADAYVTKPFNAKVLLSICNSLIKNRYRIYERFRENTDSPQSSGMIIDEDQQFMNKVISIIKENLSNPGFDMNKLGAELGYGRSKLYVKIKEKTGMTPNELTLNVKLKEAVFQLENSPQKNISQIAFDFGFSSTKYFTKCFKSFYGITPQEWRKKREANK